MSVADYINKVTFLRNDASNNSHHSATNGNENRE